MAHLNQQEARMTEKKAVVVADDDAVQAHDAERLAEVAQEVKERKLDETVPGGRYQTVDGRIVNAEGEEIK